MKMFILGFFASMFMVAAFIGWCYLQYRFNKTKEFRRLK